MERKRTYSYMPRGGSLPPRQRERDLPDKVLLKEIAAAEGNPERAGWLKVLRAEAKRRHLGGTK
jgi:hypothetical protein